MYCAKCDKEFKCGSTHNAKYHKSRVLREFYWGWRLEIDGSVKAVWVNDQCKITKGDVFTIYRQGDWSFSLNTKTVADKDKWVDVKKVSAKTLTGCRTAYKYVVVEYKKDLNVNAKEWVPKY